MNAQGHLAALVARLLRAYGGGEPYFDNLDACLREPENFSVVRELMDFRGNVVASGKFGCYLNGLVERGAIEIHGGLIVVTGGLRKGAAVQVLHHHPGAGESRFREHVFVDDTYYSGTTAERVRGFVEALGGRITQTRVVYDGSHARHDGVTSLYRYHDHH